MRRVEVSWQTTNRRNRVSSEHPPASPPPAEAKKPSLVKKILLALLVVIVLAIVAIAMQPSEFRIARSTTIDAPPPAVFDQVNDFHNWTWSPWAKLDPEMKITYEGEPAGKDAIYEWSGNQEVGEGKMTIIESRPNELVRIKLEFLKPFAATNEAQFTFDPQEGDKTEVTWSMTGKNNFMMKAFHLLMDMDKMLGSDFDKGLANMKAQVEEKTKS